MEAYTIKIFKLDFDFTCMLLLVNLLHQFSRKHTHLTFSFHMHLIFICLLILFVAAMGIEPIICAFPAP